MYGNIQSNEEVIIVKAFKVATFMAMGAASYALYDKYGKKAMKKIGNKMDDMASNATDKLDKMM